VLVLDMIEVLPPLGKYKYDTWRTLLVKCYIDNSVRLWSCKRSVNTQPVFNGGGRSFQWRCNSKDCSDGGSGGGGSSSK
jgi:hypothetical protein